MLHKQTHIHMNSRLAILSFSLALGAAILSTPVRAQNIAWGPATGITGDGDLITNGIYLDAFLPDTASSVLGGGPLAADGVTFNTAASFSDTNATDGVISFTITSGNNNNYNFTTFPTAPPSSPAFAAIMNSGGTYQNGGAGAGVVTITGLKPGHAYSVQVFNYANDNDDGLTTLSGSPSVTIGNLPGLAGANTYGEFATGTFIAASTNESFDWNGAGSGFTVLGAISVMDISVVVTVSPGTDVFQGDAVELAAQADSSQPVAYQWQTDNGSGGSTWSVLPGVTSSNYSFNASSLTPGTYEYEVVVSNSFIDTTSAPVTLDVSAASYPQLTQDITPESTNVFAGASVTFSAAFIGNSPITNQWQFSSDNGATFVNLAGETNTVLTLSDLQATNAGYYRLVASNSFGFAQSSAGSLTISPPIPQTIAWGSAMGITGDSDLVTNGVYLDAFQPNTSAGGPLAADGITFNTATIGSSSGASDGTISFIVTSGTLNNYSFTTFPTTPPSSPEFAAVMDSGGTFEFGGSGAGTVIISNLTVGHYYSVQVFNYAADGDNGFTTFSGLSSVTIGNLPGLDGTNTYGEFATGTFQAASTNESFNWTGAGSGYTVLGAISVVDVTGVVPTTPTYLSFGTSNGLTLSWPSNYTGWRLEAQTNAPGVGIGTNWVTVVNSTSTNQVTVAPNPANGSVFFRLVYP